MALCGPDVVDEIERLGALGKARETINAISACAAR